MKAKTFPERAKKPKGTKTAVWFEDEIDAWVEARRSEPKVLGRRQRKGNAKVQSERLAGEEPGRPLNYAVHGNSSQKPSDPRKISALSDLVATGMTIGRIKILRHSPTGKLLIDVGELSVQGLLGMTTETGNPDSVIQNGAGTRSIV